jgi:hypothetical protein
MLVGEVPNRQQPKQITKKNFLDRMTAFIDKDLEK